MHVFNPPLSTTLGARQLGKSRPIWLRAGSDARDEAVGPGVTVTGVGWGGEGWQTNLCCRFEIGNRSGFQHLLILPQALLWSFELSRNVHTLSRHLSPIFTTPHSSIHSSDSQVELQRLYGRSVVDLRNRRWSFLNTLFSVSEATLYLQMVKDCARACLRLLYYSSTNDCMLPSPVLCLHL